MFGNNDVAPGARRGGDAGMPSRSAVRRLPLKEDLEIDGDRLVEWVVAEGEIEAQRQIDDALGALATQTSALVDQLHPNGGTLSLTRAAQAQHQCARLASGARFAAMPRLAQVADDAAVCIARRDTVALSAVLHRLVRLSAQALRQGWDIGAR